VFWFDGALHESSVAPVDLTDRGLTLGDGLFDTSLVRNGRVFQRQGHLDRLTTSAASIAIPFDAKTAGQALDALAESVGNGGVRLTLTRGGGARGLAVPEQAKPSLFGASFPPPPVFRPLTVVTTRIRRNETSPAARLKALPYLDAILALREAKAQDADDVLFENTAGHIACLSVANLFALFGNRLVTPRLEDGVLAGMIRALILARAKPMGLVAEERSLTRAELSRADAIFATNSLRLLAPCRMLDGRSFDSAEHKSVKALQVMLETSVTEECGPA
jgi:branched-chain amino acid aminotransferase